MKTFNHTRPVRDEEGKVITSKLAPVSRVTVNELGGAFGADKRRRLVVTLRTGDVIEFRPAKTQQTVSILAVDVYRMALQARANKAQLEKARVRKVKLAEAREQRRREAVTRKLAREVAA